MTRRVLKIWRIGPALLALACLLFLLAPQALAAAETVSKGTDGVEIGEDGTVTLISGHISGEQVASVQFQLKLGEGDSFDLDPAFQQAGKITYVSGTTDAISVYIAGATALMAGDQTRLTLGTVTDPAAAELVEGSLKYVYGKTVVQQSVSSFRAASPADGEAYREQIRSLLAVDKDQDDYTPESYAAYLTSADEASKLAEDMSATAIQLQEAFAALQTAIDDLTLKGLGKLKSMLAAARSALAEAEADPDGYTADSVAALREAVSKAEAALSSDSEADWTTASEALGAVMNPVPVLQADTPAYDPGAPAGEPQPASTAAAAVSSAGQAAPNTGDETALLPWTMAMLCSLAMLAFIRRRMRTR